MKLTEDELIHKLFLIEAQALHLSEEGNEGELKASLLFLLEYQNEQFTELKQLREWCHHYEASIERHLIHLKNETDDLGRQLLNKD